MNIIIFVIVASTYDAEDFVVEIGRCTWDWDCNGDRTCNSTTAEC